MKSVLVFKRFSDNIVKTGQHRRRRGPGSRVFPPPSPFIVIIIAVFLCVGATADGKSGRIPRVYGPRRDRPSTRVYIIIAVSRAVPRVQFCLEPRRGWFQRARPRSIIFYLFPK